MLAVEGEEKKIRNCVTKVEKKNRRGLTLRRYSLLVPNLLLPSAKCSCNNAASAPALSKRPNAAGEVKLSAVVINSTIAWECDWG